MGRAVILENLGEGLYRVEYRHNSELIERRIEALERRLVQNAQEQAAQQTQRVQAFAVLTGLDNDLRFVLNTTTLTEEQKAAQAKPIVEKQRQQRLIILGIDNQITALKAQQSAIETRIVEYKRVKTEFIKQMWSADYSPDLDAGIIMEIGTIEVPGEARETVLYPASNQYRPWNPRVEGDMVPVIAQSPWAWFYNTCVFPGWQKYLPTFRFARVREILSGESMEIELIEPLRSSMDNQSIVPTNRDRSLPTYDKVSVRYLDCHAEAFTAGDEVVVQYEEQIADRPLVIGFRSHPQPCAAIQFYTALGDRMRLVGDTWQHARQPGARFGNMHWDNGKVAVSWHGWRKRYFPTPRVGEFPSEFLDDNLSTSVYHKGVDYGPAPGRVVGAGVQGDTLLAVVIGPDGPVSTISLHHKSLKVPLSDWSGPVAVADRFSTINSDGTEMWFFNHSGTAATCSRFLARLSLSVQIVGATISGQFLPIEPAGPTELGPDTLSHPRATDYVGDTLVQINEIIVGTNLSPLSTRRYICETVGLDILHSNATRVTAGFTETRVQTGRMVDYLNVSGGLNKIVALVADASLISFSGPSPFINGTMAYSLLLGSTERPIEIRSIGVGEGNTVDPTLASFYLTVEQGFSYLWQHDTISDGERGALASLSDVGLTAALPIPPLLFMGGDVGRYVRLGMG